MSASVVSTSPAPKARAPRVKKVKVDTTVDVIPPAEVAVDAKPTEPKPKKPTLPAKFAKFMQFGFFFVSAMKDASVLDDSVSATLLERLCVFASVDDQKEFYQAWLNSAKESNKTLRKSQAAARKAALPPKTRQPRAKKDPSDPKPKKPRAKKADQANDLVNQLSELASEVATELPSKKPRKPRAKKSNDAANLLQIDGNSSLDKAPVLVQETKPTETEDDEAELDVREFVFEGKNYLIDDSSNNVFNADTHEHIGVFDSKTNKLTFI